MIIITGTIKVETEQEFLSVREALIARTERSRKDSGNIEYAFSQDMTNASIVSARVTSYAAANEKVLMSR